MQRRFVIYWCVFAVSLLALGGLSGWFVLKEIKRFEESVDSTLRFQIDQVQEATALLTEELKKEASRQLVSFHVEGLEYRMDRWVKENDVVGVGFVIDSDEIVSRWEKESSGVPEDLKMEEWVLLEKVDLASVVAVDEQAYGYLAENMEFYGYEGKTLDPSIRWYFYDDPGFNYLICVHSIAEGERERGFVFDNDFLLKAYGKVLEEIRGDELHLGFLNWLTYQQIKNEIVAEPLSELFDWIIVESSATEGMIMQQRLLWILAACMLLLFIVLLTGGSFLILNAWKSHQEVLQKTTFVSSVSHELKTPLTSIRMFADLLSGDQVIEEKRAQYADTITRESQRLTSMINNLLTYSSLEHGKKKYHIGEFDLVGVVSETLSDYGRTVQSAGMELDSDLPEGEVRIQFDPSVAKQVLINLVENALKHAREGRYLGVVLEALDGGCQLRVSDKGPGIPSAMRGKVFEPFEQGHGSLTDKKSGTGLGLSIARLMMRACGGELELLKSPEGTVFVMKFGKAK